MKKYVDRFLKDQSGATAIEYALMATLIAVVIISAVGTLGNNMKGKFLNIAGNLT